MIKIGFLEVVRYHYDGNNLVIKQVRVNDQNGNYIKFAKIKELSKYLPYYPIVFREHLNHAQQQKTDEIKKHLKEYAQRIELKIPACVFAAADIAYLEKDRIHWTVPSKFSYDIITADKNLLNFLRNKTNLPNLKMSISINEWKKR